MSRQIVVRLPEDLVDFIDESARSGCAASRAACVTQALEQERRRSRVARDVMILRRSADDADMDALAAHVAGLRLHAAFDLD